MEGLSLNQKREKTAILTIGYLKTNGHKNLAITSYESMPENLYKLCIVNANDTNLDLKEYNDEVIINDRNNLSRAWNKGLKKLFKDYDQVIVPNLDLKFSSNLVDNFLVNLDTYTHTGIFGGNVVYDFTEFITLQQSKNLQPTKLKKIQHGDGSFSCYMITKEAYETIGEFNEDFDPAYFEDSDYLERAWFHKFKPMKIMDAIFFHYTQGTLKQGTDEDKKQYPEYMQKNLERYIEIYGTPPPHLPKNIKFK